MKRRNLIALAIAFVAVSLLSAWALQPEPLVVETAAVTQGVFERTVSDDGKTRVRERYVVAAPLAGRLDRLALEAGDAVAQGEVVAVLQPAAPAFLDARSAREMQERLGAAEAQLAKSRAESAKARAQLDQAKADLARQERLAREGFVSKTAREQAALVVRTNERAAEAARFAEEAAAHDYAQMQAAIGRYGKGQGAPSAKWEVRSPVTGAVLKVAQKSEGPVALGAPLLEIADARSLEAVVDVLSQDAVAIRPGMPARIELGPDVAPLAARVRLVEPAAFTKVSALGVEEQRVNVILDFAEPLDKVKTLGDGFRVDAQIVTQHTEGIKAPMSALFREGAGWAAFVVQNGRAHKRTVTLTARNSIEALIASGLRPGERVVVYPSEALREGDSVEGNSGSAA